MAMAAEPVPDPTGLSYPLPDAGQLPSSTASTANMRPRARRGATLARSLGAEAEALAVPDGADVAETVDAVAGQRDAVAVVVGSRGLGVKSRLMGSTSRRLLHDSRRPVLVVRADA